MCVLFFWVEALFERKKKVATDRVVEGKEETGLRTHTENRSENRMEGDAMNRRIRDD